jgi:hypothetical protein
MNAVEQGPCTQVTEVTSAHAKERLGQMFQAFTMNREDGL